MLGSVQKYCPGADSHKVSDFSRVKSSTGGGNVKKTTRTVGPPI